MSQKEETKNETLKETSDKYNAHSYIDAARELLKSGMFETALLRVKLLPQTKMRQLQETKRNVYH